VYGAVNAVEEPTVWRDDHVAIVASDRNQSSVTISPSQRFVLIGDVWLPDRALLMREFDIALVVENQEATLLERDRWLVAQLWEREGITTWSKLPGAFALVVWDRERQQLYLGRDRAGVRTLYYTTDGATRWIAPTLSAIAPYVSAAIDLVALRDYLCCAFVPGERTLWQQVREVRPGSSVQLPDETIQPYWHLQEQITHPDQPLEWHGDRLRSLLEQVVQEHLPPGEPVGVFLSGGLDSSCITALAAKLHDAPLHTYSIHFGADRPNELEFSNLVAQHCQTQHHILEITFKDMWEHLPETMAALDDPIGDPLTVPNLLLGRLAADSVQTVLNGEGGDPCFGGPKNQPMLINALYGGIASQNALQAYLHSFQKCAADLPQLLKPEIWVAVQSEASVFTPVLHSSDRYLNRLMALNITFKGADQILTKVNNLTRAAGIDGRSPLFDPRVIELSMTIPPDYKLSGVQEKAVLKQAVADLLPAAIVHRSKSGMMVPVQLGFREHWNRQARSLLLSRNAAIAPYLNQTLIRNWLEYNGDIWGRYGVKLWLLVSLEYWLQARQSAHQP
jgi:asparagine synthase (glutamine-hydrolysing)